MKRDNDNIYKRCIICDYCNATSNTGEPPRKFVWDEVDNGWNCSQCQKEVTYHLEDLFSASETQIEAYWLKPSERPTSGNFDPQVSNLLENSRAAVDPLQARLNAYPEVQDGS